ncbi:MAG: acyl transferase [Ferruginibacter sp.]
MNIVQNDIDIRNQIFNFNDDDFEKWAIQIFHFQYTNNEIYRQYCQAIKILPEKVGSLDKIPFLPIQFFKTKKIMSGDFDPAVIFESSGTTGSINSKHHVKDKYLYEESFLKAFKLFYGNVAGLSIIGLLPSYLERQHSSLVYMVNELINQSNHPSSGFYLYDTEKLYHTLLANEKNKQPTLLIGVTYALLDFAEKYSIKLQYTTIMETGGMKGRREELTRAEVHTQLKQHFELAEIHSEYGMTELLSQAYSKGNGIFNCPPWMKIVLRAEDDPFDIRLTNNIQGKFASGAVNIIDLANLYSCSFIATDDAGKLYKDGRFEIIGRLDNSDVRGCGLMIL